MEEQTQNSVNLEIPSRWRRFSAYLLDLIINIVVNPAIIFVIYWLLCLTNLDSIWVVFGIVIAITIIINILFIVIKKTTIWNNIAWIITLNKDNNPINWWQATLRLLVFNPAFLALILLIIRFLISLMLFNDYWCYTRYDMEGNIIQNQDPTCVIIRDIRKFANWSGFFGFILFLISVIEIFFKCPTFIDKLLWIKRFHKKSK